MNIPYSALSRALSPFSLLYGLAVAARNHCYRAGYLKTARVPVRVISVGNLTAGGTGKTPMVIFIGKILLEAGFRPAVASRGYGGNTDAGVLLVSDGREILAEPDAAGEEPCLIAGKLPVPVMVGRKKVKAAEELIKRFGPDIIILDDGFQHIQFYRDINLLLIDATNPFGNGMLLPAGRLREPVSAISRATAVIITRVEKVNKKRIDEIRTTIPANIPVFLATFAPTALVAADTQERLPLTVLKDRPVSVFSAIGNPAGFAEDLENLGAKIISLKNFRDHHHYTPSEIEKIKAAANEKNILPVTTEKDIIKIEKNRRNGLYYLENTVSSISDTCIFLDLLKE